jgi:hypothetical protein
MRFAVVCDFALVRIHSEIKQEPIVRPSQDTLIVWLITLAFVVGYWAVKHSRLLESASARATDDVFVRQRLRSTRIVCESGRTVAVGYWRLGNQVIQKATQETPAPTRWAIAINDDIAFTKQVGQNTLNPDEITKFRVERAYGGWQLVELDRPIGVSPETITIDPANGSFVYVVQHADNVWNRASVLYGSCRDAPRQ